LEEAWFLGLRTNAGVDIAGLEDEFGAVPARPSIAMAKRLVEDEMLTRDGSQFRLTARGRMISNDVFQEFLAQPEGVS
jgi:oxygen-independent coproporphyrinogen-3 oxidase